MASDEQEDDFDMISIPDDFENYVKRLEIQKDVIKRILDPITLQTYEEKPDEEDRIRNQNEQEFTH